MWPRICRILKFFYWKWKIVQIVWKMYKFWRNFATFFKKSVSCGQEFAASLVIHWNEWNENHETYRENVETCRKIRKLQNQLSLRCAISRKGFVKSLKIHWNRENCWKIVEISSKIRKNYTFFYLFEICYFYERFAKKINYRIILQKKKLKSSKN